MNTLIKKINGVVHMFQEMTLSSITLALGWTLLCIGLFLSQVDMSVNDFSGRVISSATAANIDISRRVHLFILVIFGLSLGTIVFSLCAQYLRRFASKDEWNWTLTALAAVFFFGSMQFLSAKDIHAVHFFTYTILLSAALHGFFLLLFLIRSIIPKYISPQQTHAEISRTIIAAFFISSALCISEAFYQSDPVFRSLYSVFSAYTEVFFGVLCAIVLIIISFIAPHIRQFSARLLSASVGLFGVWLTPFLAIELTQLLYVRGGINLHSPKYIFTVFMLLQVFAGIILYVRSKEWKEITVQRIDVWVYPMLIIGLTTATLYEPKMSVIQDFFEPANPGLMIQQWHDFGILPWLQNFNAHGISDAFFGFIFTSLFGLQKANWQFYDFIGRIIELLLAYTFIVQVTKNKHVGGAVLLLFPGIAIIFPPSFTILLFIPLVLSFFIREHASNVPWKKYLRATILFFCSIFLIFWRIDIGVSALMTLFVVLVVYLLIVTFHRLVSIREAVLPLIIGVILAASSFTIFIIGVASAWHVNLGRLFIDLSHILNSDQTFGYAQITHTQTELQWAWFHYGVMTCVVVLAGFVVLNKMITSAQKKDSIEKVQEQLPMLFLIGVSIITTARGLIRHSLVEDSITLIYPFGFIILCWLFWQGIVRFVEKKDRTIVGVIGGLVLILVLYSWLIPFQVSPKTRIDGAFEFIPSIESAVKNTTVSVAESRSTVPAAFYNQYHDLDVFLSSNLKSNQTFFDMSTSPMLYYLLHRKLPIYTNHQMLMHDEYLQQRTIEQLEQNDIPFVIFHSQGISEYNLDAVPFEYRYFLVSEYVYSHYRPYAVINNREVWVRRDIHGALNDTPGVQHIDVTESAPQYILGKTPALWGQLDVFFKENTFQKFQTNIAHLKNLETSLPLKTHFAIPKDSAAVADGKYIVIELSTKKSASITSESTISLGIGSGDTEMTHFQALRLQSGSSDTERYAFRVSAFPEFTLMKPEWVSIDSNSKIFVQDISIVHEAY